MDQNWYKHVLIFTGNKLAKFHGNILSLSENIAKSFRGGLLFWLTLYMCLAQWHPKPKACLWTTDEWWSHRDVCRLATSSPLVLWGRRSGRASRLSRWCHSGGSGVVVLIHSSCRPDRAKTPSINCLTACTFVRLTRSAAKSVDHCHSEYVVQPASRLNVATMQPSVWLCQCRWWLVTWAWFHSAH